MNSNRTPSQPADVALRCALEQQAATLVPIAAGLQAAASHPPIAPGDWHGPASEAYEGLERRLRSRLTAAERAVSTTLHTTRIALADLGG